MPVLKIDIKGLDKTLAKLDTKKLSQGIENEIHGFGLNVLRDMDQILARHSIALNMMLFQEPLPMAVKVGARRDIAAYVEFGTGRFAALYVPSIDPDWQAYAKSFYVNGQGRMRATPFLYPAFEKNRIELIKNLKNLLNA